MAALDDGQPGVAQRFCLRVEIIFKSPATGCRKSAARAVVQAGGGAVAAVQRFKEIEMRVMVMVKASKESEAGVMPDSQLLADMGRFNEELAKAGVILAGEGLKPSSAGARVKFSGASRTVVDGPFAETKELIAGFWLWQVRSMDEAIEWARRCPNPHPSDCELEIRPVFEAADFGDAMTPEIEALNAGLRSQAAAQS